MMMLVFQRHPEQRWREVADVLEELTTTWYFGAALIVLWLLSRVLHGGPGRSGINRLYRWLQ